MKKHNKVILYKIGRFQEDFEYIFPNIKVLKYITDDDIKTHNGIECINIKNLKKKFRNIIIICDRKNTNIVKKFNSLNFREKKDFIFLEDFAKILDEKITLKMKLISYAYKKYKKYKKYENYDIITRNISNSEMFTKMIYTDPQGNVKCNQPFDYVQIQENGFIFPCCEGWATENIGNFIYHKPTEVWNSTRARIFRLSIINKTYAFCSFENCPKLVKKENINSRFNGLVEKEIPKTVCIAFDGSCNLKCRSCRKYFVNNNKSRVYSFLHKEMIKNLIGDNWLNGSEELIVASSGEVFFSKAYQDILFSEKINRKKPITIHTNGTLLTKKTLDKLCEKYNNIEFFISLDACTKKTYEKIRIGGNFETLIKNLEYLSKVRKEGKVKTVSILYVLQKDNYKELADTVKLAIKLGFDKFDVTRINNWGTFTEEEFDKVSMYDKNGNEKKELLKILEDPIFSTKKIEIKGNVLTDKKSK